MAALKVTIRKLSLLRPDPRNARLHAPSQIEQLAATISRFGYTNPILADFSDGGLISAGHGRVMALELIYKAGGTVHLAPGPERGGAALPKGTIPAIDCSGWTEEERMAYALADNQLALQASWDVDLLEIQLKELREADFNIADFGFDQAALEALAMGRKGTRGKVDPDAIPEPPEDPVSRPGDIWLMGDKHRLICGDSTDPDVVAMLLDGEQPQLMVTDPPYGVDYDPEWRLRAGVSHNQKKMGAVLNDDRADWTEAWRLFPGDVAYVWHGALHAGEVAASLESCDFAIRSQIIWAKDRFALGRGNYHWQHEPCHYAVREGGTAHWVGGRDKATVWNIAAREDSGHGHGTQKPVECMKRPIENNSRPGDAVYEPFSGAFTTGIACEMTARRCFAVELNPAYVDLGVERWEQFTGGEAILAEDGRTFAAVALERTGRTVERPEPVLSDLEALAAS